MEEKSVSYEIITFLKRWLRDHTLVTDKKYASALRDAGYSNETRASVDKNAMANKRSETHKHKQRWKIW